MNFRKSPALLPMLGIALSASPLCRAQNLNLAIEASKVAVADGFTPDDPYGPLAEVDDSIPGYQDTLSYFSFDMSEIPEGGEVVTAELNVFDWNKDFAETTEVYLADVPADYDPETLTYNLAVESYGATALTNEADPNAGVDPAVTKWFGTAFMDNIVEPGGATVGARRTFESEDPYEDSDFVAALNEALAAGDEFVTFIYRGRSTNNNNLLGINYADSEPGPVLALNVAVPSANGPVTDYDFNDGTLQGWQNLTISTLEGGPTEMVALLEEDASLGNSSTPTANSSPYFVGPTPFEAADNTNVRDLKHETFVVRSPEFRIYPNGSLSFALIGGSRSPDNLEELADLPAESLEDDGTQGMALRDAETGEYLAFYSRAEDGGQFWENFNIWGEELADLVSADGVYTLDFIDSTHGGWGWCGFDDVVISEGSPVRAYDFNDGTLQGWESTTSSLEGGPTEMVALMEEDASLGNSSTPTANSSPYFVGPTPFEAADNTNVRDLKHETFVVRSPEFRVFANGSISFALIGGSRSPESLEDLADLPAESLEDDGVQGMALRNAESGEYLAFYSRAEDGGQFWENFSIQGDELAGLTMPDDVYILEFIDSTHGGWGWCGFDDVIISQGTPGAVYSFDDGSLQGWVNVMTSTTANGPTEFAALLENDDSVGDSSTPIANSSPYLVGPTPFEGADGANIRDNAHETLVLRSPEFILFPNGSLSFSLLGGMGSTSDLAAANNLPASSTTDGILGVGLRQVTTGEYVGFYTRSEDGSQFWERLTLDNTSLRGLVAGETYTLDLIDTRQGGWAWVGLDDVQIVEGSVLPVIGETPAISIAVEANGDVMVTFEGTLQVSDSLQEGSWEDLPDATSPYRIDADGEPRRFVRAVSE